MGADPIAFLSEQLAAVEAERDELALKAERLSALQRCFVAIAGAADESALARETLSGARRALGFSRALWFSLGALPMARFQLDGGEPEASDYGDAFPPNSALVRIARGESDAATGYSDDVDAPLFDTRGWYVIAAVRVAAGADAILYVDGAKERAVSPWAVASLQELATQAALALGTMRMAHELEQLAMHDPLTGLFNRRALMDRFATELATAKRTKESLAFAMIDVDNFKAINDSQGHAGGDAVLQTLASIFTSRTRETDVAARFAGDEFSLIMPRTDRESAAFVLDRIYESLRSAGLGCSTGVAFYPDDGETEEDLFSAADRAVYVAKAAGKNVYRLT